MVVSSEFSSSEENTSSFLEEDQTALRYFTNFPLEGNKKEYLPLCLETQSKYDFYVKTREFLDGRT